MLYRVDYIDGLNKPRVFSSKSRRAAEAKVDQLVEVGWMVITTNWLFVQPEERGAQRRLEVDPESITELYY